MMSAFARLLEELPISAPEEDSEGRLRLVLRPLLERIVANRVFPEPVRMDPVTCPNCGDAANSSRAPYCSPRCRDTAGFVRQFRSAMKDGALFDKEKQAKKGQALWDLQGGGFPMRQKMVPPRVIGQVIARHEGLCAVCGAPATEIDHTGSG